jgi:hypothetical protein
MKKISRRKTLSIFGTLSLGIFLPTRLINQVIMEGSDVCKKAWESLGRFTARRYQFRYIEPSKDLPKVFLYGDSISIGYTEYARASLDGLADVYRLHANGGSSKGFIELMEKFRTTMFKPHLKQGWDFEWDVIHFNVGLHDLKYVLNGKLDKENGTQVSSLRTYEHNLRSIIEYLKTTYPKAKLIFATTTPVPEGEPGRIAGDAKRYNKRALRVMRDYKDIQINDLYKFSLPVIKAHAAGPGNVHFDAEGSRLQGIEVARIIGEAIGVKPGECPSVEVITERSRQYESTSKDG